MSLTHDADCLSGQSALVFTAKTCTKCRASKSTADFSKNKSSKDGLQAWCRPCHQGQMTSVREQDRLTWREYHRNYMRDIKDQVIAGYGNKCACCGETTRVFLTIDHVNGGGHQERLKDPRGGNGAYMDALKSKFPPDYQVLCFNCNWAKHKLGICPHQTLRVENINGKERQEHPRCKPRP